MQEPFRWVGTPNHITLNGHANGTCPGQDCSTKYPVIEVDYDTEYRLRWIHAGSLMYVSAGIEKHELKVIEADGTDLRPVTVGHLEFAPGERYSTLLKTKTQYDVAKDDQQGLYIINLSSRWRSPGIQNLAVLRYKTADSATNHDPYIDMKNNKISLHLPADLLYYLPKTSDGLLETFGH